MIEKRKSEMQSPVNYWWNEFLFVKHFIVETDLSPDEAADQLKTLQQLRYSLLDYKGCIVEVGDTPQQAHETAPFNIRVLLRRYTTLRAEGTITQKDSGHALVQCRVKFGWVYFVRDIGMFLALLFFVWLVGSGRTPFPAPLAFILLPFIGLLFVAGWWQMLQDRNRLIRSILAAVDTRKGKSK